MSTDLTIRGGWSRKPADHARRVIAVIVRDAAEPVLFSCVRLTRHRAPGAPYPVVAHANLDLPGRTLRVCVGASSQEEAVDLLAERLEHRLGPEGL